MVTQSGGIIAILFVASLIVAWAASLAVWSKQQRSNVHLSPEMDWCKALFVSVVSVVVFVGWIGVILASLGFFSLLTLSVILLAAAGAVFWFQRPFKNLRFRHPDWHELALMILLLGCSVVYFRPHEYIVGGTDAGSYMNIGATIAHTGKFIVHDDWTQFLNDYASVTLRQQPPAWLTRNLQFVGWYIDDTDPSRIIPQFYPFHPTLIAIGISLAGLYGGLMVTPIWGVLSIAAVYFASRRLFGSSVGLLAAVLVALTPTHIWFARYPTAEPLTLLLVFSSLFAFQTLWDDPSAGSVWGIFGGAALGVAFLARIDLPAVALLVLGTLAVRGCRHRWSKGWSACALTLGVLLVHAILSAWLINWPYSWNTYSGVLSVLGRSPLTFVVGSLGGVLLVIAGGTILWQKRSTRLVNWLRRALRSREFRWLLVVLVILLSTYAYFLRPILEPIRYATSWPSGNQFPILDGQNWVRLGWYLTPLGLFLATLGLAEILRREPLDRLGLFLAIGTLTTIQYVYNIFNTPYHIYAMRRYVPIVIPMLIIYTAVALVAIFRMRPTWLAHVGGGLLTLGLMAGLVYQARFVLPQRDMYGAVNQLSTFSTRLRPNSIIVISEPAESSFGDTFGVPLRFIFGHDIATIRQCDANVLPFIERMMAYAAEQHRPVQLIAVDPIAPAVRDVLRLQPVEMFPVTFRMLMNTFYDYPSVTQTAYYGLEIYDVMARDSSEVKSREPIEIDVGTLDTAFIRSGFYSKELLSNAPTTRWTSGEAALDIPLSDEAPVTVELRAMIFRPEGVPAAVVTVWLDGQEIGQFVPNETWQTFSFQAQPRPNRGTSSLQFTTVTFNPASLQVNNDMRDLGFLIDWVRIAVR